MQEVDISRVLRARLKTLSPAYPILWENQDKPETMARPYLIVEVNPIGRNTPSTNGAGKTTARGFIQVMIVGDLDQFDTPTKTIADSIILHLPKALKLEDAAGIVTITKGAQIAAKGFRSGSDWLLPVQCDYIAI